MGLWNLMHPGIVIIIREENWRKRKEDRGRNGERKREKENEKKKEG